MQKIINDPVHGFITIDDALILQLLEHPYFQRLRRIKQMALAYLVYPGAVHTRFHHALGAYHLMCLAIDELKQKKIDITPEEEQGAKIAILLHDIGHGPFSHALEHTIVDVHHEQMSQMMMLALQKEFQGKLTMAIEIFNNTYPKPFLHQLVSSQLDTDRLDYLARDSFFSGVSEGIIGYARIIKMLTVHGGELMVEEKGIHSIEKFLIARRLMYSQVYLHKTVLSAEIMLVQLLKRAKWLTLQGIAVFATPALSYFLSNLFTVNDFNVNPDCLTQFAQLDDHDMIASMKVWMHHEDEILSTLATCIVNRRLFKLKFTDDVRERIAIREKVAAHLLTDAQVENYIIEGETTSSTYIAGTDDIRIVFKDGQVKPIGQIANSLITEGLLVPIKKPYICYISI